jgi:choline dehydrogenase-like flavoprotein
MTGIPLLLGRSRLPRLEEVGTFPNMSIISLTGPTPSGARQVLKAKKEVILSAGVVGTPTILLHSGIGDKHELKRVGIQSSLHLPDVGKHFHNHALMLATWQANTSIPKWVLSNTLLMQGLKLTTVPQPERSRLLLESPGAVGSRPLWPFG